MSSIVGSPENFEESKIPADGAASPVRTLSWSYDSAGIISVIMPVCLTAIMRHSIDQVCLFPAVAQHGVIIYTRSCPPALSLRASAHLNLSTWCSPTPHQRYFIRSLSRTFVPPPVSALPFRTMSGARLRKDSDSKLKIWNLHRA